MWNYFLWVYIHNDAVTILNIWEKHRKFCKVAKAKDRLAVKLKVENEPASICLEEGTMIVLNIANHSIMSGEQYIIVYWNQLGHNIFSIGNMYIIVSVFWNTWVEITTIQVTVWVKGA